MSYKFPIWRVTADQVVEIDDLNQDFEEIIGEAAGELNEHNWHNAAFTDRKQLADDAAYRLFRNSATDAQTTDVAASATAAVFVPINETWNAIAGLAKSFTTRDGFVWVLASFQHTSNVAINVSPGMLYAIRVDGQVLPETVTGPGDPENEAALGYGVVYIKSPVVVEAMVPVAPGTHLIEVVGKRCLPYFASTQKAGIQNRELILLLMER